MSDSHETLEGMGRVWSGVEVRVKVDEGCTASLWFHDEHGNSLHIGNGLDAPTISEAVSELDAQFREELMDMLGLEE